MLDIPCKTCAIGDVFVIEALGSKLRGHGCARDVDTGIL